MMGLRTELHFHKATLNDMRRIFPRSVIRRRVNRLKVKSSSFRSVVNFVAICISPIITAIRYGEIFADYGYATMGLRTELRFHKAEMFFTAEDGFVFLR